MPRCPRCGNSVRPDKNQPGKFLCDSCKKRFPGAMVIDDEDVYMESSRVGDHLDPRGRQAPPEQRHRRRKRDGLMEGEVSERDQRRRSKRSSVADDGMEEGSGSNIFAVVSVVAAVVAFLLGGFALFVVASPFDFTGSVFAAIARVGIFSPIPGIVAIAFGVIGLLKASSTGARKLFPVLGIVLGLVGGVLGGAGMMMAGSASSAASQPSQPSASIETNTANANSQAANANASASSAASNNSNAQNDANASSGAADPNAQANANQAQPQQPQVPQYVPGVSDGNVYSNSFFGINLVPQPPYALCTSEQVNALTAWRIGQLDPTRNGSVQAEAAALDAAANASVTIVTGIPAAFSMAGSVDAYQITSEQAALKAGQVNVEGTQVNQNTCNIAGVEMPCVVTSVPMGNNVFLCSVEAYFVKDGRVVLYTGTAGNVDEAARALSMITRQ